MNYVANILLTVFFSFAIDSYSPIVYAEVIANPAATLSLPLTQEQQEWLDQHQNIRVGAMNDWPPLDFINLSGNPDGFGVALVGLLNQRLGGRLKLVSGNWPELYQNVVDKQLDALMDLTPNEARQQFFNFTQPYLNIPHVIIGRDKPPYYLNEAALQGKSIALEKGFGNVNYYRENYPLIHIIEYPSTSAALGAVSRGDAEAYIGNRAVANYIMQNELIDSLKVHGRASKEGSVLAFGVRKDWPQLATILQIALSSISAQEFHALLNDVTNNQTALGDHTLQFSATEQQWLQDHPIIRLASDSNWAPFEYFDQNGLYQGIAADFVKLIENKLNISFIRSPISTRAELIQKIQNRELDVLSLAMDTPSKRQYAIFTHPYVSNTMVIVTQSSVEFVPGIEGLVAKSVAVGNGYASHELLSTEHPEILLHTYPTSKEALLAVTRGEAFAYIGNIATTSHIIQENGLSNLRISGEIPYQFQLGMGVRSDWPIFATILDKAIASISDHEKAEIFARWIHVKLEDSQLWKWMIGIVSILTLLIAITLYWNYLLNQKVKQRTQLLEHRALHDELTELPNRTALKAELEQRILLADRAAHAQFAVLFIDLDDFKKVNDTLGHSVGDLLLLSVTQRLKTSLRKTDFISRFGGDEFIVITEDVQTKDNIETLCTHLLRAMKDAYQLADLTINMTMSIGATCYPQDGESTDELLRNADTAMYAAKQQGRNRFNFFSGTMNEHMNRRVQLEEFMPSALKNKEMYFVFQPIINLKTKEIIKFEVLTRWNNSKFGMISPDEFIPLAEHNGFIIQLGETILSQSIETCQRLRKKFNADYDISVNISPRQLSDPNLISKITSILQQHQFPAYNLILEITEGVLIAHNEQNEETVKRLTEQGIRLAMDDFGKGYSSLSYIRKYPFNILKIDKEFIQDIPTDTSSFELVSTVLAMANSLQLEVIAEGVETQEQEEQLLAIGCNQAQGYYYSHPLKENELVEWLLGYSTKFIS